MDLNILLQKRYNRSFNCENGCKNEMEEEDAKIRQMCFNSIIQMYVFGMQCYSIYIIMASIFLLAWIKPNELEMKNAI